MFGARRLDFWQLIAGSWRAPVPRGILPRNVRPLLRDYRCHMHSLSTVRRTLLVTGLAASVIACSASGEKEKLLAHTDTLLLHAKYPEAVKESRRVLQIDENDPRATRQIGLAHLELGELTQAYHYLLKARAANDADVDARIGLGSIYAIEGESDETREQADFVLHRDSTNPRALLLFSGAARRPDDIDRAIGKLQTAPSPTNNDVSQRLALGALYLRKRDTSDATKPLREAVSADTKSVKAFLTLEQRADAERALQRILDDNQNDLTARRLLAELALTDGRADRALSLVTPILVKDSSDVDALVLRGRARLAGGELDDATGDFAHALRGAPKLAPTHYYLGVAHIRRGNATGAKASRDSEYVRARSDLEEATKLATNFPEAVFQLAELNIQLGAARSAIADLEQFVAANPGSVRGQALLGTALVASGRNAEANETFMRLTRMAPINPEPHYLAGLSYLNQKRIGDARREFETAVSLSPAYADPVTQLVMLDLFAGSTDSALARVQKQLQAAPQSAPLYDLLGWVHGVRKDRSAAEAALLKAVQLDSTTVDAHMRLAELYNEVGKFDQAVMHAGQAQKLDPKNARAIMDLGLAYQLKGDATKARQAYEAALSADPRLAGAANNLAFLLSEQGDQDAAYKMALQAQQLAPDDPQIADTFGWVLFKRGEYGRALQPLKDAATKLPDSPNVQYHFGMVSQKLGDVGRARAALTKAVNSSSAFANRDEARKALDQLK